jgi:hypothetical protein
VSLDFLKVAILPRLHPTLPFSELYINVPSKEAQYSDRHWKYTRQERGWQLTSENVLNTINSAQTQTSKAPFISIAVNIDDPLSSVGRANIALLSTTASPATKKYSLFWYEPRGKAAHDWKKLREIMPENVDLIAPALDIGNRIRECGSQYHDRFVSIGYGGKCLVWCTMFYHAVASRYALLPTDWNATEWHVLGDIVASVERSMDGCDGDTSSVMMQSYTTFIINSLKLSTDDLVKARPTRKIPSGPKKKQDRHSDEVTENMEYESDDFYRVENPDFHLPCIEKKEKSSSNHSEHKGCQKREATGILVHVALRLIPGDRRTAGFQIYEPSKMTMLNVSVFTLSTFRLPCLSFPFFFSF